MSDLFIQFGENLRVVPAIHHRIPFSQLLVLGLSGEWQPEVVAVELPASIKSPVLKALTMRSSGQLLVARRMEEWLSTTSLDSMTGMQHTKEVCDATRHAILSARKWALTNFRIRPGATREEWSSQIGADYEPAVLIFGKCEGGLRSSL